MLKSIQSNLQNKSLKDIPNLNDGQISFIRKLVDILEILHFGIATKIPMILEGILGQEKKTAAQHITHKWD
jgi:hypothetical protein